ncbi:MAG: hypothetical protein AAGF02_14010 [Actinomycetota bacterium]
MSDDDDLLADLARVLGRVDPPPDHVREAAAAAIELRAFDAELAELLDEAGDLADAGVRSADLAEPMVFEVGDVVVEVEVVGDELHLQVAPTAVTAVVVRAGSGSAEHTTDDLGRLSVPVPDERPIRFELDVGGRRVVTDWVVV